jgi:hypothetical protein
MRRTSLLAAFGLLLCATSSPALEAVGTIKKVDLDKGMIVVFANGQDRNIKIASDVKVLGDNGKPLTDGLKAKEFKEGADVTVTVELAKDGPILKAIRVGKHLAKAPLNDPPPSGKPSVGLKPLTEMTASDKYKGEDGGLYASGKNEPPASHKAAARKASEQIQPLAADGKPSTDGKIVVVSISMSNATQEFSLFKQLADRDPAKSPLVKIVDCAQGGKAMAQWVDPRGDAWKEADRRLDCSAVDPKQVQVAWIKLANVRPMGELTDHGKKLEKDTLAVIHNARERFPNLRIIYLGSRIYAGYANTQLNPEPYAYEGGFVVRWLIQDQIKGNAELNYDSTCGPVKAPVLLWGPYFWGDGTTPRKSDGLVWERKDLAGDGTHPSESGRKKVADMLLTFFKTDPYAKAWFVKQ